LLESGKEQSGNQSTQDRTMNGDTPMPDLQDLFRVLSVGLPLKQDVVESGSRDGSKHQPDDECR